MGYTIEGNEVHSPSGKTVGSINARTVNILVDYDPTDLEQMREAITFGASLIRKEITIRNCPTLDNIKKPLIALKDERQSEYDKVTEEFQKKQAHLEKLIADVGEMFKIQDNIDETRKRAIPLNK